MVAVVEEDIYDSCGATVTDTADDDDTYGTADAIAVPMPHQPIYELAETAGAGEMMYEDACSPYRSSVDMAATLAALNADGTVAAHDYVLADEVGVGAGVAPDVCYDTATAEMMGGSMGLIATATATETPWFAEPEYALGAANHDGSTWFAEPEYALGAANPDDGSGLDGSNSIRVKSVHRSNPLNTL